MIHRVSLPPLIALICGAVVLAIIVVAFRYQLAASWGSGRVVLAPADAPAIPSPARSVVETPTQIPATVLERSPP